MATRRQHVIVPRRRGRSASRDGANGAPSREQRQELQEQRQELQEQRQELQEQRQELQEQRQELQEQAELDRLVIEAEHRALGEAHRAAEATRSGYQEIYDFGLIGIASFDVNGKF